MGSSYVIITAEEAAEHAAKARAKKREDVIRGIPDLEQTNPLLFDGLQVIFKKVEANFLHGWQDADFNMDKLFGSGRWHGIQQRLSDILRDLGYKVDYSCSSNEYNERLFLSWKKPKG